MKDSQTEYTGTNFSTDFCENTELHTTAKHSQENLNEQLLDFFAIRLSNLEESYAIKDKNVTDQMFSVHAITLTVGDLKSKYAIINTKPIIKRNVKQDDLNCSNLSTMSKRSTSSRISKANFLNKPNFRDKFAVISPSVAINIGDGSNANTNKMKSIEGKKLNIDDLKDSPAKGKIVTKEIKIMKKEIEKCGSPLRLRANQEIIQEKMSPVQNKFKKIQSNQNSQRKNNSAGTNNASDLKSGNMTKKPLTKIDTSTSKEVDKTKFIKSPVANSKFEPKKIVTPNKASENKNAFKKMKSDAYSNANTVASLENEAFLNSILVKDPNLKLSYKFEPKKSVTIAQNISNYKFSNTSVLVAEAINEKAMRFFSNKNNSQIFDIIMNCFQCKEKVVIKNINLNFRRIYFEKEISLIKAHMGELKMDCEENPFSKLELPKMLINKMASGSLILSNYFETYKNIPSFIRLVDLLYQGITLSSPNEISLRSKIDLIETSKETKNIYFYFETTFLTNIKSSCFMYETLSKLYEENNQSLCFQDLPSEFGPFVEFFFIIRKILSQGGSMLYVIDREILSNKLEILKAYYENI